MKSRISALCLLTVSLILLFSASTAAQAPDTGTSPPALVNGRKSIEPSHRVGVSSASASIGAANATVDLGKPGLNFRYVRTFGETAMAYFDDPDYLNGPSGVSAEGNNLWIAEGDGRRALKFASDGSFLMQIGKAGFRYAVSETDIVWLSDVAVDPDGNIWLVDAEASHIIKFDAEGNYVGELGERWSRGPGNDQFNVPISIAFDGAGNIYVSDTAQWGSGGNSRVQIFDNSGNYLSTIGETGVPGSDNAHLDEPRHIAVYDHRLYVADDGNHRVQIFSVSDPASPTYVATLGVSGEAGSDNDHFDQPQGVAVDAGYIYVADTSNDRIQIFDRETRAYVTTLGVGYCSDGNEELCWPTDVAVDTAGNLYVADGGNTRVQQFDSNWNYVRTYGTTKVPYLTDGRHYNSPGDVAVAPDGSIYITEHNAHRLIKVDAAGVPQWVLGEAGIRGDDETHLRGPGSVALDTAGRIYIVETWGSVSRIKIYNSDGSYSDMLGSEQGSGDYEFDSPQDIAIDQDGNIYVADRNNHRVQIYDSSRTYVATLGETGVPGSDNAHLNNPWGVAVDSAGNIYVVEQANHRVQVFDSNQEYVRTVGVTGECGNDFGSLCNPTAVAVDEVGRIYVTDQWGGRIQVFNGAGAYLTTIGGSRGGHSGQLRNAGGLAVDVEGNLYIADTENHRIQKFAPGVPGWKQRNINGFGTPRNQITTLALFDGVLYAGTFNTTTGAQLWQRGSDGNWSSVVTDGFGDSMNVGIDHLIEFNGDLYAGTWNYNFREGSTNGGEVWRSENGEEWSSIANRGFGVPSNSEILRFAVFKDALYAGTWNIANDQGAEIWRTTTGVAGDWNRVVTEGFEDSDNLAVLSFAKLDGYLYTGTINSTTGGQVWRTPDGTTWTQVNTGGFGDPNNRSVRAFAVFDGYLYAGTSTPDTGGQIWRCSAASGCDENADWVQVVSDGFGDENNTSVVALIVSNRTLYAMTYNGTTGMEVWRSNDGQRWDQVGYPGFGDSNNSWTYWDNGVTVFDGSLYIGTWNFGNGGELWQLLHRVFLPLIQRSD